MAQTKRKRRTKHRGTAAGTIQTRGRTGRPPTADEKKKEARAKTREQRLNTPPTWQGSFKRALLASALMFVFIVATTSSSKSKTSPVVAAVFFALFALALYVPAGYYLELFLYRRRQRRKAAGR